MENIFNRDFFRAESFVPITVCGAFLGISFQILFPDSRGTHLSCIEDFEIFIDDTKVDTYSIRFCLGGKAFFVPALPVLSEEYWNLQEYVRIKIYKTDILPGKHKVMVRYNYRVPFTGGRGNCVRQRVSGTCDFRLNDSSALQGRQGDGTSWERQACEVSQERQVYGASQDQQACEASQERQAHGVL